jgi:hypothetical protein
MLAQVPGSAGDLASSIATSPLTSGPSGLADLIMADRILVYQAQASATYAHSSRLSLSFASFSAGGQQSFDKKQTIQMPRSIGGKAGVSISYALDPRTNIGVSVDESFINTQFQNGYSTSASVFLSRQMGRRWFLNLNGGINHSRITATGYAAPPSRQIIGGGNLGYRTRSHTFLINYIRSSQDVYGTTAGLNTTMMGVWGWNRPGSGWRVYSNFGQTKVRDAGFTSFNGWRASAGLSRTLSNQFSITSEYSYLFSDGTYLGVFTNRSIHAGRLSIRWHPLGVIRPRQTTDLPDTDTHQ